MLPLSGTNGQNYLSGEQVLPFIPEDNKNMQELLSLALIAVECENSLWKAKMMPDFQKPRKPQRRLGGRLGLAKNALVPNIIIKDEDLQPLIAWQSTNNVKIHVWHVFFDMAYGLSLDKAIEDISSKLVTPVQQTYQAPNGVTTTKSIYKFSYYLGYLLGESTSAPSLEAKFVIDKNGHILPYVHFEGGNLQLSNDVMQVLHNLE